MKNLYNELDDLQKLKNRIQKSLAQAPQGRLKSKKINQSAYHYYLVPGEKRGSNHQPVYIRQQNTALITQLAQKEYDQMMLRAVNDQIHVISTFLTHYHPDRMKKGIENISHGKRMFVKPYVLSDQDYLERWYATHPQNQNPYPITNGFKTERGELVRSKSEKIIIDMIYRKKVPYAYEAQLMLPNRLFLYPDLTLLNLRTRETFYYEHFGMMDDPDYCKKAIEKMEQYESFGIIPGQNLLFSMECRQKPLNIEQIEQMIDRMLL